MRADLFLVEHGFATTRSQAQRLIGSGVQWRVLVEGEVAPAWKRVAKNGDEIPASAELQVLDNTEAKYISRGGLKLEGALKATKLNVEGLRCLDIGQSTGGFTDCLLQNGAAQVVGVDVGHGQLHATMRADERVVCIEGVNARSLTADDLAEHYRRAVHIKNGGEDLGDHDEYGEDFDGEGAGPEGDDGFNPLFDFLTGDLSFISLTLVLPAVARLLKADGHLLMLVKPQFELQPGQIGKGGIVRDPAHFAFVEKRLRDTCAEVGVDVLGWMESAIEGGDGNREFFIHGKKQHNVAAEEKPLAAAPVRNIPKRTPRSELRALHAAHEDSEEAHAGQHGPARSKRKKKYEQDQPDEADGAE
ncbi:MAG: TlyA family RNA methyltransferase [Polaromonas sp.]|uniref:TlyA family RNA methyltransferase n=1 Tax=Polaromonas sp. TaxID=1869339 RepID=UPI0025E7068A|nr:TlyA family RNA methyltransferase [Polaromonas sp.]MBI2727548.1 TlyA family RNA methyltransferase [Polaromonas sp.]